MTGGERAYLDCNATSPLRPEAAAAIADALARAGNPSSVHAEGRAARALVEAAREAVAALVGASPAGVVFTSGGSEANALALSGSLARDGAAPDVLVVGAGEHPCVLDGHGFPPDRARVAPLTAEGVVDVGALAAILDALPPGRALVAVQVANGETGVLQPVPEIAAIAKARGALVHADAAQAAGRIPVSIRALGVDSLALSAHKLGGPQGAGALVLAEEATRLAPLLRGGGQERGRRAGTENVPGIAGFGAAARAAAGALAAEGARLARLRDALEAAVRAAAPDAVVFGAGAPRLPNTLSFALPGLRAETALIAFDLAGVALSSGSACSSGKVRPSHVLAAMGVAPDLAAGALRASLGFASTEADVIRFSRAIEQIAARRRSARAA